MKRTQKLVLALMAVIGIVAAPAVWSNGTGEAAQSGAPRTLKIIYASTPQPAERAYVSDVFLKKFEQENNCKVTVEYMAQGDANTIAKSEQDSGNVVTDVFYVHTGNAGYFINSGYLLDLSDVVSGAQKSGSTLTKLFDSTVLRDGKYMLVPTNFDIYISVLNKKAEPYLAKLGLSAADFEKGLTWEQYADLAIAIAKGEGKGKTMFPASATGSQLLYPMGGMSLAFGGGFPEFESAGFRKAAGILAKMAAGDAFYGSQNEYNAPTDPLKAENVWLTFAHMAPIGIAYEASPNSYLLGPGPKGSVAIGSTAGAYCWGIAKGTKNEALARKFVAYTMRPDVNYGYCSGFGGLLSPIQEVINVLDPSDKIMKVGLASMSISKITGLPTADYTDWNAVKLLYIDMFNEILSRKAVPDDAFFAQKEVQRKALLKAK